MTQKKTVAKGKALRPVSLLLGFVQVHLIVGKPQAADS